MANVLSDVFANMYTVPRTLNPALSVRGAVYFSRATVQLLAAHAAGTIYPMFRMTANARVLALFLANDALASVTDLNFGIYTAVDWTAGDGVVKSVDKYCDGISLAVARDEMIDPSQVLAGAIGSIFNVLGQGTNAITGIQWARRIFEDAGDATEPRPGTEYDLCLTSVSDPAGTGNVTMGLLYVFGS